MAHFANHVTESDEIQIVQFNVTLSWSWGSSYRVIGVRSAQVMVEGCSTSAEAITKAIEMCKPLREDPPTNVSATVDTFTRRIPKKIGSGSTVQVDDDE